MLAAVDESDGLIQAVIGDDREHRAEDLFLHDGVVRRHAVHDRRLDAQRLGIALAAEHHLRRIDQPHHAVVVLAVDHVDVLRIGQRVFAGHGGDMLFQQGDEVVLNPAVDEQVIRRDAGLAAVEQLAEGEAFGCQIELGGGINDARALAAQLERDGREVLGRLAHDLPTDGNAAGEEDIVKPLLEQRLVFLAAALHDGDVLWREAGGDDLADDGGRGGRVGGGLEQRAVASGQRADERLHRQHERIVPRGHDQHHTVGIVHGEAARVEMRQRREHAVAARPAVNVAEGVGELGERHADLAHVALRGGLAQILLKRSVDLRLMGENGFTQPAQRVLAEGDVQRLSLGEIRALGGDSAFDVHQASSLRISS